MAFIPPQGNKTVMVDNNNNIVYPAGFQKVIATQATIAGNNFTSVPSVIDPENATTTQLPSVASVVSYVADVVEGGSSGLIPAIQSDIQTLEQVKFNRGEFWFQGGSSNLNINSLNYNQGDSFSFAVQIKATLADVIKGARIFQFNTFNLYFNTRLCFYCPSAFGDSAIATTVAQNNKILDGNWHSIICTYDGITCKLFDEDGLLISASGTIPTIANAYFTIGNNFVGQMSRIKYFNFDMSSDDAPYTIADYIRGKDESPLLNGGGDISLGTADSFTSKNYCTITESENGLTFTTSNQYSSYASVKFPIVAGQKVEVSWEGEPSLSGLHNPIIIIGSTAQVLSYSIGQRVYIFGDYTSPKIITATNTGDYLGILLNSREGALAGDTATIKGLKIKVNGTLLSLDDYSISVGGSKIVPDVSGNLNDATITGAVYGSKDNSIARLSALIGQANA